MGLDNPLHIAFLVVILLLVFGARRLPEIGRSLGSGMREFKDSITGESKQPTLTQAVQPPEATPAPPAQAQAPPAPAPAPAPPPAQSPVEPTGHA
jgi:sec-independent protein translocase protein TatA